MFEEYLLAFACNTFIIFGLIPGLDIITVKFVVNDLVRQNKIMKVKSSICLLTFLSPARIIYAPGQVLCNKHSRLKAKTYRDHSGEVKEVSVPINIILNMFF